MILFFVYLISKGNGKAKKFYSKKELLDYLNSEAA
jgi:hypothetical protein